MSFYSNRCGARREALCLLAGGVLQDTERSAVEHHLASCSGCQKYYDEIKNTTLLLTDWEKSFRHVGPDQKREERWNREFQAAAGSVQSQRAAVSSWPVDFYQDIFRPCRRVWAGLAAVWLGIFAVHFSLRDTPQSLAMKSSRPPAELVQAFLANDGVRAGFGPDKSGEKRVTPSAGQSSRPPGS